MQRLLSILILLSNVLLLGSEPNIEYTQNTCHRTYWDDRFNTDEERQKHQECSFARFEAYDRATKDHIAHIAYEPSHCFIDYLLVDEQYKRKGIGTTLAHMAIEDMRKKNCDKIYLNSSPKGRQFWKKLGARQRIGSTNGHYFTHVFSDSSSDHHNKPTNHSDDDFWQFFPGYK